MSTIRNLAPLLFLLLLLPSLARPAGLEGLKIGVVNINAAMNRSAAGERSKNILLASKSQKENELKAKEAELKQLRDDLKNNIMLTDDARSRKEKELREQERALRREVQQAQKELQIRERKLTESIFIELKTVIDEIAKEEKYDLILEQNASQVILFSSAKFDNITERVIERYNKFQAAN